MPDVSLQDMTQLIQLIADGKLLDQPPTIVNLKRSVAKIMTPVIRENAAESFHKGELRMQQPHNPEK